LEKTNQNRQTSIYWANTICQIILVQQLDKKLILGLDSAVWGQLNYTAMLLKEHCLMSGEFN